jgi:hypothetical protein
MHYCCRLRCTVSGGLEQFAEAELTRLLVLHENDDNDEGKKDDDKFGPSVTGMGSTSLAWHFRGHSGSQLDILCHSSQSQFFRNELVLKVVENARYIDHVSIQVLSRSVVVGTEASNGSSIQNDNNNKKDNNKENLIILDIVSKECEQVNQDVLESAMEVWHLWQPRLSMVFGTTNQGSEKDKGELVPTPSDIVSLDDTFLPPPFVTSTNAFQVNTIYTRQPVAHAVVRTFVEWAKVDEKETGSWSHTLWLDAGAGAGALLQEFPKHSLRVGVDLNPQHESVVPMNFFDVSREWLQSTCHNNNNDNTHFQQLCIISNPPFAQGSRGDSTIIGKFLQHALHLQACCMGLIVPVKFSHVWKSFGLPIQLRHRMNLPLNSFYDPSSATYKNVQCQFLYFDLRPTTLPETVMVASPLSHQEEPDAPPPRPRIHILAKRDKGQYPKLATVDLTVATVKGLAQAGVLLGTSKDSSMTMTAKLANSTLELFLELNPKRPLSIVNSVSGTVPGHSLGWLSTSVKPPLARAMNQLSWHATAKGDPFQIPQQEEQNPRTVTVNVMCGEGTLVFESCQSGGSHSCFQMVGDKNPDAVYQVAKKVLSLQQQQQQHLPSMRRSVVDFVIWDAQHMPLRNGIADAVLADLPFAGSVKKVHQEPAAITSSTKPQKNTSNHQPTTTTATTTTTTTTSTTTTTGPSLSYRRVFAETLRVLVPSTGCAVLVSPDSRALTFGCKKFSGSWKEVFQTRLNIGGIAGKLCCLVRKDACWKDQNLWVQDATVDYSVELYTLAHHVCAWYVLNDSLELEKTGNPSAHGGDRARTVQSPALLSKVFLNDVYLRSKNETSHSYRFCFHPLVNNAQVKTLIQAIVLTLDENPIHGTQVR